MTAAVDGSEIRTERLLLRPMRMTDADRLFALFAQWPVMQWLSSPPWPYSPEDAHAFLQSHQGPDLCRQTFAITLNGALIGGIDVRMNEAGRSQRGAGPNLGYWLGEPYWSRGYMTEAARGFLGHVFAAALGDIVYSGAFTGNPASLRVQQKLGFVEVGETMLHSRPRGGEFPHINTELPRDGFVSGS